MLSTCMWLCYFGITWNSLQWRYNVSDGVANHQPHDCSLNRVFRRRSNKTSNLRVTGLCEGNSPVTGEFPSQWDSKVENVFIWWRLHVGLLSALYQADLYSKMMLDDIGFSKGSKNVVTCVTCIFLFFRPLPKSLLRPSNDDPPSVSAVNVKQWLHSWQSSNMMWQYSLYC